ncbi:MFS transporter [Demequina globuliformis]|uniref:MFS transporter n=1 Tax=Demequina globuliformis TaxID=676202 RepID=UPI000784BA8B|nr:MFS transporter [Demequina globuliformis]
MTDLPSTIPAGQPRWRLPRTAHAPRARWVLASFALVGFVIGLGQNSAAAVIQNQVIDLDTTVDVLGYTMVAYSLGVVVGAPVILVGLGRVGRRPLLIALAASFAALSIATVVAPTAQSLMVIRFLTGLPHGALLGVASFVAMSVLGRGRRGQGVAIIMLGLTFSQIVGVPLMQWLSNAADWRVAYAVVAFASVVALAAVWAFTPDVPGNADTSTRREIRAFRSVPLWTALIAITVGFSGLGAVFSYIVPLLEDTNGLSATSVTWALVMWGVATSTGAFVGGKLTDRSHVGAGRLGLVLTGVALLGIGVGGSNPVVTLPTLFLLGVATQIYSQSAQVHLMDVLHGSPSLGSALSHAALNAASALGAGLGAVIIGAGMGYQAPAWAALALTAVAFVIALCGPGYRRVRIVKELTP